MQGTQLSRVLRKALQQREPGPLAAFTIPSAAAGSNPKGCLRTKFLLQIASLAEAFEISLSFMVTVILRFLLLSTNLQPAPLACSLPLKPLRGFRALYTLVLLLQTPI